MLAQSFKRMLIKRAKSNGVFIIISLLLLLVGALVLQHYFTWNVETLAGIALLPFVWNFKFKQKTNFLYFPASLAFGIWMYAENMQTCYFFCWVCIVMVVLESRLGRSTYLLPILLLIISPLFTYVSQVAGIPARLFLSSIATMLLTWLNLSASAQGNIILLEGQEFAVDHACVGLGMIHFTMLLTIALLANKEKTSQQLLKLPTIIAYLGLGLILNVISNLFRILLMIVLKIPAGTLAHDCIGIICLAMYVYLPLIFVFRLLKVNTGFRKEAFTEQLKKKRYSAVISILGISILILLSFRFTTKSKEPISFVQNYTISGYQATQMPASVVQFRKKGLLVYVKPVSRFYGTHHAPMVCWTGNGYEFKKVHTQKIDGIEVYFGDMVKGREKLFSSWWFDNGKLKTNNQLTWRWHAFKEHSGFFLVNINAADPQILLTETKKILHQNIVSNGTTTN